LDRIRKIAIGYIIALLLMVMVYPLMVVGLLILRRVFENADRRTLMRNITYSLFAFTASLPFWIAKVFLGISSYHKVLGVTPIDASPLVYNGIHAIFLILQFLSLYFIFLTLRELTHLLNESYLRTSGTLLMLAVPMHLISIQLYFAVTYTAIALLTFSFFRIRQSAVV